MLEFQCEAILFDLDGVLVDSTKSVVQIWTAWSENNGIPPARTLEIIHGCRTTEALEMLAPHLDIKSEAEKIEAGITFKKGGTVAIPGAGKLLNTLPPDRWCVVTSGLKEFAEVRLKDADLPVPKILVSAEDVTNGKPHPEPYLKGAKLLGKAPADCLVIEDALAGLKSAHAGGMKAIGLTTTFARAELKDAEAVVQNLLQIEVSLRDGALQIRI
ncbi:MAG TPA: HAD-IA family hydrolase [Terriglobales bacterium]